MQSQPKNVRRPAEAAQESPLTSEQRINALFWDTPGVQAVISLLSGLLLLFLAYLMDYWFQSINGDLVDLIVLITYIIATLLFATAGLTLFWYILVRAQRAVWLNLVLLVAGLLVIIYPLLHLFTPMGVAFPTLLAVFSPGTHVYYGGGLLAGIGLLGMTLPARPE